LWSHRQRTGTYSKRLNIVLSSFAPENSAVEGSLFVVDSYVSSSSLLISTLLCPEKEKETPSSLDC
jgi:hypothetical protein